MNKKTLKNESTNLTVKNSGTSIKEVFEDNFDPEIFDFVVTLNKLNFSTFSSCQGHMNHLGFCPFVLFCSKLSEDLPSMSIVTGQSVPMTKEKVELLESELVNCLKEQARLLDYLNEFYSNRNTEMSHRLIIQPTTFCRFLISPMFEFINSSITDIQEQTKLNQIALKEMHDFSDFLKTKII